MTFDTERDRVGREPVTIVEIDLDKCAEVYGVSACTASKAAALSCHNTRKTCQDPDNYNNTAVTTYKFSDRDIDGGNYIPCIVSNTLSPIAITPGQPFNKRASITIALQDFAHHDRGIDPYVASRSYTPEDQGTFFGKLIARNPFYQGRPLRLITGYVDASGTLQTQTENYILEEITFGKKGQVMIVAKDVLKLADDERSFAPVASTGKLEAAITNAATSLTVTSGTENEYLSPDKITNGGFDSGDDWTLETDITISGGLLNFAAPTGSRKAYNSGAEVNDPTIAHVVKFTISGSTATDGVRIRLYSASGTQLYATGSNFSADGDHEVTLAADVTDTEFVVGVYRLGSDSGVLAVDNITIQALNEYIRIGNEVILAPYANRTANVFASLTRGAWNTTASAHSLDDSVQTCLHYDATNVVNIIRDLLVSYVGIDPTYITTADWETEKDKWLAGHNLTALLTDPTGINTLLDEISEQLMVYIWWDAVNQKIRLKAIAPPDETLITLNEDDHIVGEVDISIEAEDRKTRVLVFYNPRTPLDFGTAKDFKSFYGNIDAGEESADKNNDIRQKIIYARWITGDSVAATTASRTVNQFRETPKVMKFLVDAKEMADNAVGDYINIQTRRAQAFDGSNDTTLVQILSIEEMTRKAPGTQYKFTVQQAQFGGRYARIMSASDASVYSSASDAEKTAGCYILAAGATYFSDGGEGYKIP